MIELFYTTSVGTNVPQQQIKASVGGYRSSTKVINDDFGNLFGEISTLTIKREKDEYSAIMLLNTTAVNLSNVNIWFVHPKDSYSELTISGVEPALTEDGDYIMERVTNKYSKPMVAEFEQATVDSKYNIGILVPNVPVGIWIRRNLLLDFIKEDQHDLYMENPSNPRTFLPKEKNKKDTIQMFISWD